MQRHIFSLACSSVLVLGFVCSSLAQTLLREPIVQQPAGVTATSDALFVADSEKRQILYAPTDDLHSLQPFLTDDRFLHPSGIATLGNVLYIADPEAKTIFSVNLTTKQVSTIWAGSPLEGPNDVVVRSGARVEGNKVATFDELVIADPKAKGTFHLELNSANEPKVISWQPSSVANPNTVAVGRSGSLLIADKGGNISHGGIFSSTAATDSWSKLLTAGKPADDTIGTRQYFHEIDRPSRIYTARGIYYVLDDSGVYASGGREPHPVHLTYGPAPITTPIGIVATGDRLIITGSNPARIVSWPLMAPVVVDLRARVNTSEALSTLYRYLWNKKVLPMVGVKMPYVDDGEKGTNQQPCSSPQCVVAKRKILVSPYVQQLDDVLCDANPTLCRKGKWTVHRGDRLFVPEIPYETYLGIDSEVLDGQHSVQDIVTRWIPKDEDPDRHFRSLASEKLLQFLNPNLQAKILPLKTKGTVVNIPTLHYRLYLPSLREDLQNPKSDFWQIQERYREKIAIFATEVNGKDSDLPATPDNPVPNLKSHFDQVKQKMNMSEEALKASHHGENQNILVFDEDIDPCNPVFFDDQGQHAFPDTCDLSQAPQVQKIVLLDTTDLPKLHYHGTCVSSIIGARRTPYGESPASHSSFRRVGINVPDLANEIAQHVLIYKNRAIVNVSREATEAEEVKSWENLLTTFPSYAQNVLFVAAAGNDTQALDDRKVYPAFLASQLDNVISVGAMNYAGTDLWVSSNYGTAVDLLAPGEHVPCAVFADNSTTDYAFDSGTSMAAPLVSAVAALLLERNLTPAQVKARLLSTSAPIGLTKNDERVARAGILDAELALSDVHKAYLQNQDDTAVQEVVPLLGHINFKDVTALPDDEGTSIGMANVQSIFRLDPNSSRYRIAYWCRVSISEDCGLIDPKVRRSKSKQLVLIVRYDVSLSGSFQYANSEHRKVFVPFAGEDIPDGWTSDVNRKLIKYVAPIVN